VMVLSGGYLMLYTCPAPQVSRDASTAIIR
jgi:hypothetical protein